MPFQPGQSGNPSGKPVHTAEVKEALALAKQAAPHAIRRLCDMLASSDERVVCVAANALLDRAIGKPQQAVQLEASVAQYVLQVPQVIEATNTWIDSVRSSSGSHSLDHSHTISVVPSLRSDSAEQEAEAKQTAR